MNEEDRVSIICSYYVEFQVSSVNYKTTFASGQVNDVKEYMQFVYPELNKLNYEGISGIPAKVFSCIRTTLEHEYEYCYYLRYTTTTPKVIIIVTKEYNTFFLDLLRAMLNTKEFLNPPLILQRCMTLTNRELKKSFITLGNFQITNKQPNYIIETIKAFGVNTFVDIVFKMLLEERFIFHSCTPETIHPTIQAFLNVLQPFVWQHILIPILPLFLSSYLSSILPCIIGCTRGTYANFMMEFGEDDDVHVIDIDKHQEVSRCIRENYLVNMPMGIFMARLDFIIANEQEFNDEDVVKLFKQLYKLMLERHSHFFKKNESKFEFAQEMFLSSTSSFKEFLKHFSQSQMFFQFIEEETNKLNHNLPISPIINETCTVRYRKLQDISSIQRRCGRCLEEIVKEDPVFQYQDNSVHHRQCARCIICNKFSDRKKCLLCGGINEPITKQDISLAYKHALQKQYDKQKKISESFITNEPIDENDLKYEFVETFQRSMKNSIKKLLVLSPNERTKEQKKVTSTPQETPKHGEVLNCSTDSFTYISNEQLKPQPSPPQSSSVARTPHNYHPLPPTPPKQQNYPIPPPQDEIVFSKPPALPPRRSASTTQALPTVPTRTYPTNNNNKQLEQQTKRTSGHTNSSPNLTSTRITEKTESINKRPLPPVPNKRTNFKINSN
ncbi:DENN (AEX-3) domain containing protein [Entamoeba histolytica HM-3:IMSS]|uniref:DENN (AEX3) domain containing protein n=2 Tax=Entamoeba histolytica TaxID=5759 RepID=M2RVJ1_ENTHI|nr:DENN (AEX3) domain containing protein [Entamoeba histolytica KU27]EMS14502.1 DENN (AEX-3) domain containing protein [Entamoeba histolytica HM-3:IMSS]